MWVLVPTIAAAEPWLPEPEPAPWLDERAVAEGERDAVAVASDWYANREVAARGRETVLWTTATGYTAVEPDGVARDLRVARPVAWIGVGTGDRVLWADPDGGLHHEDHGRIGSVAGAVAWDGVDGTIAAATPRGVAISADGRAFREHRLDGGASTVLVNVHGHVVAGDGAGTWRFSPDRGASWQDVACDAPIRRVGAQLRCGADLALDRTGLWRPSTERAETSSADPPPPAVPGEGEPRPVQVREAVLQKSVQLPFLTAPGGPPERPRASLVAAEAPGLPAWFATRAPPGTAVQDWRHQPAQVRVFEASGATRLVELPPHCSRDRALSYHRGLFVLQCATPEGIRIQVADDHLAFVDEGVLLGGDRFPWPQPAPDGTLVLTTDERVWVRRPVAVGAPRAWWSFATDGVVRPANGGTVVEAVVTDDAIAVSLRRRDGSVRPLTEPVRVPPVTFSLAPDGVALDWQRTSCEDWSRVAWRYATLGADGWDLQIEHRGPVTQYQTAPGPSGERPICFATVPDGQVYACEEIAVQPIAQPDAWLVDAHGRWQSEVALVYQDGRRIDGIHGYWHGEDLVLAGYEIIDVTTFERRSIALERFDAVVAVSPDRQIALVRTWADPARLARRGEAPAPPDPLVTLHLVTLADGRRQSWQVALADHPWLRFDLFLTAEHVEWTGGPGAWEVRLLDEPGAPSPARVDYPRAPPRSSPRDCPEP